MRFLISCSEDALAALEPQKRIKQWPRHTFPKVPCRYMVLRAQRGSHIPTLRPKYIAYSYMDPLGLGLGVEVTCHLPRALAPETHLGYCSIGSRGNIE